jgi:ABC-2 type transport system ATP-binding protein
MMIETRGLRKSFGDHVVLDGIDLDVAEGSIFALLGSNGAGKTTTV